MARTKSRGLTVYSQPRQAAPIIRVAIPRARAAPKAKRHSRRRSGGGGGNLKDRMMKMALGGAAVGFIQKSGVTLPTIPMLGTVGTIALGAYFLGGQKPGLMQDIAMAGAVLAGYELGHDGKISGEDD